MKNNTNTIIAAFFCLVIFGCRGEDQFVLDETENTIYLEDVIPNTLKYSDLFDSIILVPLETNDESLIGRIDKLILYNDQIIILDRNIGRAVYLFSIEGEFLGNFGKLGKGPGEYIEPRDISIDRKNDCLVVYDNNKRKLLWYNFEGAFIKSIQLDRFITEFTILGNDIILYIDNLKNIIPERKNFSLLLINENGKIKYQDLRYPDSVIFSNGGKEFLSLNKGGLLLSPNYSNRLYHFEERHIQAKYYIDFGNHSIPSKFFDSDNEKEFASLIKNSNYSYVKRFWDTGEYMVFSFPFRQILYYGFYNIASGDIKVYNQFINDLGGVLSCDKFLCSYDEWLVGYTIPNDLDFLKSIILNPELNSTLFKNEVLKTLPVNNSQQLVKFKKVFDECTFVFEAKDIELLSGINNSDNPVVILLRPKSYVP